MATLLLALASRDRVPTVDRSTLLIDTVRAATLVRDARAPGSLVAEHIQWVTAQASARVERLVAQTGSHVERGSVLLQLANPDVQIQVLQAEQQARQAEREALAAKVTLAGARITQQGMVASLRTQWSNARQEMVAAETLLAKHLLSPMEARSKQALLAEMEERLQGERARLLMMQQAESTQLSMLNEQAARLKTIAAFQRSRYESLVVRAPEAGVVQELSLQTGQWVPEGTTLAKIVAPGRLKAVLRVPETQAKDVQPGQMVAVDTRNGVVPGRVTSKAPSAQNGVVVVDIQLDGAIPAGAVPDVAVEGTIELERTARTLVVGRPAGSLGAGSTLFRFSNDERTATRVPVSYGRIATTRVEVLSGLRAGDRVIVSDTSPWDRLHELRVTSP